MVTTIRYFTPSSTRVAKARAAIRRVREELPLAQQDGGSELDARLRCARSVWIEHGPRKGQRSYASWLATWYQAIRCVFGVGMKRLKRRQRALLPW